MAQYTFGSGTLWGLRTDGISTHTPIKFGAVQEVSFEISSGVKELHGQYQFPLAVGRGTAKITGKCKNAQVNGKIFSDLYFAATPSTGQIKVVEAEAKTIPASAGPYTITCAQGTDLLQDMGVTLAATGAKMVRVASNVAAGQYIVDEATGVYTFAAADAEKAVLLDYTYTYTTSGVLSVMSNALIGVQPIFQVIHRSTWDSKDLTFKWEQCISTKIGFAFKNEDFMIPELDFSCFANSSGNVVTISAAE